MSRPTIVWAQVRNYFERRNFIIKSRGGEKIIQAPRQKDSRYTRSQVVIGHKCCNHPKAVVYDCYLSLIKRAFGVRRQEILED